MVLRISIHHPWLSVSLISLSGGLDQGTGPGFSAALQVLEDAANGAD